MGTQHGSPNSRFQHEGAPKGAALNAAGVLKRYPDHVGHRLPARKLGSIQRQEVERP